MVPHPDGEGAPGLPLPPPHLDERPRSTATRRRDGLRVEARTPVAGGRQFHVPEPLVAPKHAVPNPGQVEVMDLPRTIVAPDAPPDEPELAGGPLAVGLPVFAAGDDRP